MNEEQSKQLEMIYRALFEVPQGSPEDTQPLISDLRKVVNAYKRASWVTRALIWLLPTIAGLGVAMKTIIDWFSSGGGSNG